MNNFQKEVDERSSLTQSNKLELLLFTLGGADADAPSELYGINVFKVREIVPMPELTAIAQAHRHMLGVINLRGQIIPVIDLPAVIGCVPKRGLPLLIITEFARTTQAFAVESVDDITRLDWTRVMPADHSPGSSMITSIAKLEEEGTRPQLAQVLDVESIVRSLSIDNNDPSVHITSRLELPEGQVILAADDSVVARLLIESALKAMGLAYIMVNSGKQAWQKLEEIEAQARSEGKIAGDKVALVLSDLEMPEMDGFTLTRMIKKDGRFSGIPVVIHSSLSGQANEAHVKNVGADAYIAKFVPEELAALLHRLLQKG